MFIPRQIWTLTLVLCALCGWAEPSHARAIDSSPTLGQTPLASILPTGRALPSVEISRLDDEVETPDEEEDDEPDDPGDALDPGGRPGSHPASLDAPGLELLAPVARPNVSEGASFVPELARFLSLCRFLC